MPGENQSRDTAEKLNIIRVLVQRAAFILLGWAEIDHLRADLDTCWSFPSYFHACSGLTQEYLVGSQEMGLQVLVPLTTFVNLGKSSNLFIHSFTHPFRISLGNVCDKYWTGLRRHIILHLISNKYSKYINQKKLFGGWFSHL